MKRRELLYLRGGRYYADLRTYADVGGGQEAMRAPGQSRATDDRVVAAKLLGDRLKELETARARGRSPAASGSRASTSTRASTYGRRRKRVGSRWRGSRAPRLSSGVQSPTWATGRSTASERRMCRGGRPTSARAAPTGGG